MNPRGISTSRCLSCVRMIIGKVQHRARGISVCREPLQVSEEDQLATSCRTGQHKEHDAYCEQCPCCASLDLLANKWSALIIGLLDEGAAVRFTELKVALPGIGPKMLTQTLRRLESASLVDRTVYAEVPQRVEYTLSALGRRVAGPVHEVRQWAEDNIDQIEKLNPRWRQADAASLRDAQI
jgi:DNA-binding HxlR family transcriptional regulator